MSSIDVPLTKQAEELIRSGQKKKARTLLQQAIRQDATDHVAWILMTALASSPEASLSYARQAELLKPGDPMVLKARDWAERRANSAKELRDEPKTSDSPISENVQSGKATPLAVLLSANRRKVTVWAGAGLMAMILISLTAFFIWGGDDSGPTDSAQTTYLAAVGDQLDEIPNEVSEVLASPLPSVSVATATATPFHLLAKNIAPVSGDGAAQPRSTWTPTPSPTNTPVPTATPVPTFISPQNQRPASRPFGVGLNEKWIDVDLTAQTIAAYEGNNAVYSSLVSSGTWDHPTVTGQFRVWLRYRSQTMDGRRLGYDYYLENVPYVMYFYEDYALHGTFWHNNFGTPMSHGCVNLKTSDAEWIFNWSELGTVVNVHY